jgi:hypothetical protein
VVGLYDDLLVCGNASTGINGKIIVHYVDLCHYLTSEDAMMQPMYEIH